MTRPVTADPAARPEPPALRPVVARVAALNLGYFGIEIAVALAIGSVALIADSLDFLEDAAINLLIFAGLSWSARNRAARHRHGVHPARAGPGHGLRRL